MKSYKVEIFPQFYNKKFLYQSMGTARYAFNWALNQCLKLHRKGITPTAQILQEQFESQVIPDNPWINEVMEDVYLAAFAEIENLYKSTDMRTIRHRKRGIGEKFSVLSNHFMLQRNSSKQMSLVLSGRNKSIYLCIDLPIEIKDTIHKIIITPESSGRWFAYFYVDDLTPLISDSLNTLDQIKGSAQYSFSQQDTEMARRLSICKPFVSAGEALVTKISGELSAYTGLKILPVIYSEDKNIGSVYYNDRIELGKFLFTYPPEVIIHILGHEWGHIVGNHDKLTNCSIAQNYEKEYQADEFATIFMARHGYPITAACTFMAVIARSSTCTTHPPSRERARKMLYTYTNRKAAWLALKNKSDERIQKAPKKATDDEGWIEVRYKKRRKHKISL